MKKNKKFNSVLSGIRITLPALNKTYEIQKKVANVGFDYINNKKALNKVQEELNELKKELNKKNKKNIKEELGDLIFAVIDLSRKLKYNPEIILSKASLKFSKRFKFIEKQLIKENKQINKTNIKYLEKLWSKSKQI